LIIEAREKSGSLITAKLWLDMWKDLFAIPWEIFRWGSVWTNNLIKNWEAKLVLNSKDILEEYSILIKKNNNKVKKVNISDPIEKNIYDKLSLWGLIIDELVKKLDLDIKTISFKLSMMEISWLIKKDLSWKYEIK
jgi:DNA processing protein